MYYPLCAKPYPKCFVHKNSFSPHRDPQVDSFTNIISVQFNSVPQLYLTLCDPMDCNSPGLPVHHQLPELAQTHVLQIGDAIQPSHPLSSPSPPVFTLSQPQGLFQ